MHEVLRPESPTKAYCRKRSNPSIERTAAAGKPVAVRSCQTLISQQLRLCLPAPLAAQLCYQFPGFNVEFPLGDDLPFVKPALAEGFALGQFAQRRALKLYYLGHESRC